MDCAEKTGGIRLYAKQDRLDRSSNFLQERSECGGDTPGPIPRADIRLISIQ